MNKMNKKGFTLIEMLVVIAIIAVLVSIIIPTVSSATEKAGGAANAANLRSVYAELQTDKLSGTANTEGYVHVAVNASGAVTYTLSDAPAAAKAGAVSKGAAMVLEEDGSALYYTDAAYNIEYFAAIAETGKAPTTNNATTAPNQP